MSVEECEAFKDYTITYQADAVFQNDKNMDIVGFGDEFESYTEDELVQSFRANLGEWWNGKEKVFCGYVISTENFFGSNFFIADDDTLWIYYEGVFFLAKKI